MSSFTNEKNNLLPPTTSHDNIKVVDIDYIEEEIKNYNYNSFDGAAATWIMAGSGKDNAENQDNISIIFIEYNNQTYAIINIFDGHGIEGLIYSSEAKKLFNKYIRRDFIKILENPYVTLNKIFTDVNTQLYNLVYMYLLGGSTVTINIISDGLYICANLADCDSYIKIDAPSDSIIIKYNNNIVPTEEYLHEGIIKGTTEHNYKNTAEAIRVLELDGTIKYHSTIKSEPLIDVFNITRDDQNKIISLTQNNPEMQIGRYHINVNRDLAIYHYSGESRINLTRAVGDYVYNFIRRDPDIVHVEFEKGHKYKLISGSDGYFNCYSQKELFSVLSSDISPSDICKNGYTKVGDTFGYDEGDNTTICVINFIP